MDSVQRSESVIRPRPTWYPLAFPAPVLVGVTDTNALASRACNAARRGLVEDLFAGLAATGRSNIYISAHVPAELTEHLADVAAGQDLELAEAEAILWGQIMPRVPVVDLAVGDYLHPRVRPLMRSDPDMPHRLRGDVDDVGTAALAEFLAPAVIISADSVFNRFGLAHSLTGTWLPAAYAWLRAAGFEATLTDTAILLEVTVRMLVGGGSAAVRLARNHPVPALAALAAAAFFAWRAGYLHADRLRAGGRRLMEGTQPLLATAAQAFARYESARAALWVIEPYGAPTVAQLAARHLARYGQRLPLYDLQRALTTAGYRLTVRELTTAVEHHPAFTGDADGAYGIGTVARARWLDGCSDLRTVTTRSRTGWHPEQHLPALTKPAGTRNAPDECELERSNRTVRPARRQRPRGTAHQWRNCSPQSDER